MADARTTHGFYDALPKAPSFEALSQPAQFAQIPDDWVIGTADIVTSRAHIAQGQYKTVNMVGAAVISAVMNALDHRAFPFVFTGDGAGLAVWPEAEPELRAALAATRRWAEEAFALDLRTAVVPVADCVAAGRPVLVARYPASEHADYAMFAGGGLSWAEAQMKEGRYQVPPGPSGDAPDLTGLACRWAHMPARQGVILSLVMVPVEGADPSEFVNAVDRVTEITRGLERGGHPAPETGPAAKWPHGGVDIEAKARQSEGPFRAMRRKVTRESHLALVFLRLGLKLGGFDARHYVRTVAANADFRKFDDGLKMTIDCDPGTRDALKAVLADAQARGGIRFGLSEQSEAMMTCIVPSALQDDHVHFIDGATGGYALAVAQMDGDAPQ